MTYAGEPEAKLHERRLARIKIEWSAQAQNSSAWPAFLSKRGTPDAAGPILAAKAKPLFSAAGSQGAQFKSAIWIFKSPSAQRFETSAIGAFDAKGHLIGLLAESSLFAEPPAPPQKTDSP